MKTPDLTQATLLTTGQPDQPARPFPRLTMPSKPAAVALFGAVTVLALAAASAQTLEIFGLGLLLVFLADPVVNALERRGIRRGIAAGLTVLVSTLVAAVAALLMVGKVASEAARLILAAPQWLADIEQSYRGADLPESIRVIVASVTTSIAKGLGEMNLLDGAINFLAGGVGFVTVSFGVLPFFAYFVLTGQPRGVDQIAKALPGRWRPDAQAITRIAVRTLGRYVRSEALLMAIVGAGTWLGLHALSLAVDNRFSEYALLLALFAAAGELIPLFGPWLAVIPALVIAATMGPNAMIAVAGLYLTISIVEGQILVPKLQSHELALHPALVIVLLFVAQAHGGIIAAVAAVPVAAAGRDIFAYVFRRAAGMNAGGAPASSSIDEACTTGTRRSVARGGATPAAW